MSKARKMLSDWRAPYIQSLMRLIETQSKATLAIWALDYAEQALLPLWCKSYPFDRRPQNALNAARAWLSDTVKLPQAKAAILACHTAAREADGHPVAQAAARAIGPSIRRGIASGLPFTARWRSLTTGSGPTRRGNKSSNAPPKRADAWKALCAPLPWPTSRTQPRSTGNADRGDMMAGYTEAQLEEALQIVSSAIGRCEKMQPKFAAYTSHHTLLKNRIKALYISKALMTGETVTDYTKEELTEALRPISSIIGKCEKAQLKFEAGTPNHTRFQSMIKAMYISKALITDEISKRG